VDKQLPARPNLDHLRGQAKALLADLKEGNAAAARAFIEHLPAARDLKPATVSTANFKLADAQSVVARQSGFASWPVLTRHVEQLRSLEGAWRIARLEIDGNVMPANIIGQSRILIDGDRFRTESPEGTYEGIFTIDTEASPPHFDIHFVAGPEAGNDSLGIFRLDGPDQLVLCLGLVHSSRPAAFATRPGGGHALEHLHRVSAARPDNVTGGTAPPAEPAVELTRVDPAAFAGPITPMIERLAGAWDAIELVTDGKPMPEQWLTHGVRTMTGTELKVVFGGQTMVHARVRIDAGATPIAIDYVSLLGKHTGTVSHGIMEWLDGGDVRFLMPPAGAPRPTTFDREARGTLSRWRKRPG
jgi:uncharacterized protein (TIGR03067 family)